MNRVQILSAILGLLVLAAGALLAEGYFKTWEDYREPLVEEAGECVADLIITVGNDLQCKPWLNPQENLEQCVAESSEVKQTAIVVGAMACLFNELTEGLEDEGSDNI